MTNEIRRLEIRTSESGVAGSIGYLNFGIPLAFVIRASSLSDRLLTRLLLQRLGAMSEHEILFGWLSERNPRGVRLSGSTPPLPHNQTRRWGGDLFASSRADPHLPVQFGIVGEVAIRPSRPQQRNFALQTQIANHLVASADKLFLVQPDLRAIQTGGHQRLGDLLLGQLCDQPRHPPGVVHRHLLESRRVVDGPETDN